MYIIYEHTHTRTHTHVYTHAYTHIFLNRETGLGLIFIEILSQESMIDYSKFSLFIVVSDFFYK